MKQLIELGAKPRGNQVQDAARLGASKMVKLLVEAGADPNGTRNNPPLVSAAYRGERKVVEYLLTRPEIDVNKHDIDGLTPIWAAVHSGDEETIDLLLNAGADPAIRIERGENAIGRARRKIEEYKDKIERFEALVERMEGVGEGEEADASGVRRE